MAKALQGIIIYSQHLDTNARESLTSIHYWAGYLSQKCKSSFTDKLKLCVPDSKGKMRNYIWEAIKDKNGKQADVLNALKKTKDAYERLKYTTGRNRFEKEIDHMLGQRQCKLSIDREVCNSQICTVCNLKGN